MGNKLTDRMIKNYKPKDKAYKVFDGQGLFLQIKPNGSKLWRLKYRFKEKEKLFAIGKYPEVTLAEARQERDEARRMIFGMNPQDPLEVKKEKIRESDQEEKKKNLYTLSKIAQQWFDKQESSWSSGHSTKVRRSFEMHVFPILGDRPISEIEASELLDLLRVVQEGSGAEVSSRILQRMKRIFRMAIIMKLIKRNPATDLEGVLKAPKHQHYKSMNESEIPNFFKKLNEYDGRKLTKLGLELIMHTALRTSELRLAKWDEIQLEGKNPVWKIPGDRMKMGDPHIVPLSKQALHLLKQIHKISGAGKLVFPGDKNPDKAISYNTLRSVLMRIGYRGEATVHGFRGLFSTSANETGRFRPDVIERQLAHAPRDKVRGAYNHAEYLEERRLLLQWWSDRLENFKTPADVINFQKHKRG